MATINLPSDQYKMDEWVIQTSKIAGKDLRPCYEFWGWELTERVRQELTDLILYFFDDDATRDWAPARTKFILERYPNATREVLSHSSFETYNSWFNLCKFVIFSLKDLPHSSVLLALFFQLICYFQEPVKDTTTFNSYIPPIGPKPVKISNQANMTAA